MVLTGGTGLHPVTLPSPAVLQATGLQAVGRCTDRMCYIVASRSAVSKSGFQLRGVEIVPFAAMGPAPKGTRGLCRCGVDLLQEWTPSRPRRQPAPLVALGGLVTELDAWVRLHPQLAVPLEHQPQATTSVAPPPLGVHALVGEWPLDGSSVSTNPHCEPVATGGAGFHPHPMGDRFHENGGDPSLVLALMSPEQLPNLFLAYSVLTACKGVVPPSEVAAIHLERLHTQAEKLIISTLGGSLFGGPHSSVHFPEPNGFPISTTMLVCLGGSLRPARKHHGATIATRFVLLREDTCRDLMERPHHLGGGLMVAGRATPLPVKSFHHAPAVPHQNILAAPAPPQEGHLGGGAEEAQLASRLCKGCPPVALLTGPTDPRRRFTTSIYDMHYLPLRPNRPLPALPSHRVDGVVSLHPFFNVTCAASGGALIVQRNQPLAPQPGMALEDGAAASTVAVTVAGQVCRLVEATTKGTVPEVLDSLLQSARDQLGGDRPSSSADVLLRLHRVAIEFTHWVLDTPTELRRRKEPQVTPETYANIAEMCAPTVHQCVPQSTVGNLDATYSAHCIPVLESIGNLEACKVTMPASTQSAVHCFFDSLAKLQTAVISNHRHGNPIRRLAALVPLVHTQDLGVVHAVLPLTGCHKRGDTGARSVMLVTCTPPCSGTRDAVALFVDPETGTDPEYFSTDPRMQAGLLAQNSSVRHALGLSNTPSAILGNVRVVTCGGKRPFTTLGCGDVEGKHCVFFIASWKVNGRDPVWSHSLLCVGTTNRSVKDIDRQTPIGRLVSQPDPDNGKTHAASNHLWAIRKMCDL